MWISEGVKAAPANGLLLADSGPAASAGSFSPSVVVGSDVGAVFRVEHRNAANDNTLESFLMATGARDSKQFALGNIEMAEGERVRVVSVGLVLAGNVQAAFIT